MRSMLYGVEPTDPTTFVTVPVFFAASAICASLAPARRAACADPAATVRTE